MQEIAKDIYIEDSLPGVIVGAIIHPKGTLMIDAPLRAEDARSWKAILLHQGSGNHRLLVNLDGHHDRILGNRAVGCDTIAHIETIKLLENRPNIFKGQNEDSGSEWENLLEVLGTRWLAPNLYFTDSITLHWNSSDILLEHHPGPEPGALWVIVPEQKVVFIGDTVVLKQPPFLARADIPQWLATLKLLTLKKYRDYTIISSRGGKVTQKDIRDLQKFLKGLLGRFERLASHKGQAEQTERFVNSLLKKIDFRKEYQTQYEQRLHYGLYKYYTNHYSSRQKNANEKD